MFSMIKLFNFGPLTKKNLYKFGSKAVSILRRKLEKMLIKNTKNTTNHF